MTQPTACADSSSITDVGGVEVGHFNDSRRPTGCTVIITRAGAVGGVDVRGAAPGTRETDLLHPSNLVNSVHAVLLAGGSAWGLDAAAGVMMWLEEHQIGLDVKSAWCPSCQRLCCLICQWAMRESGPTLHRATRPAQRQAVTLPPRAMQVRVLGPW